MVSWLLRRLDRWLNSWWALVLAEHDTEPAELSGGVLKIAIGAWLLLPWETFDSSPTFVVLRVLPETVWGIGLMGLGIYHLAALRSGDRTKRLHASTVGYLVWFSMAVVFVITNPPAIGWLMFLTAGLAQLWCSIRLGTRS